MPFTKAGKRRLDEQIYAWLQDNAAWVALLNGRVEVAKPGQCGYRRQRLADGDMHFGPCLVRAWTITDVAFLPTARATMANAMIIEPVVVPVLIIPGRSYALRIAREVL